MLMLLVFIDYAQKLPQESNTFGRQLKMLHNTSYMTFIVRITSKILRWKGFFAQPEKLVSFLDSDKESQILELYTLSPLQEIQKSIWSSVIVNIQNFITCIYTSLPQSGCQLRYVFSGPDHLFPFIFISTLIFFFLWLCQVLIVAGGIQFPDWGLNRVPCTGSLESQPLDHQGSPYLSFLYTSLRKLPQIFCRVSGYI